MSRRPFWGFKTAKPIKVGREYFILLKKYFLRKSFPKSYLVEIFNNKCLFFEKIEVKVLCKSGQISC